MNDVFARFRLLPLLVLVASLAFAVRVGETYTGVRNLTTSALASEEKPVADAVKKPEEPEKPEEKTPKVTVPASSLPEVWADPAQQEMSDNPEQLQLLEDLAKRRDKLIARARELDTREAMMKAGEKQLDEKIKELSDLKQQIEQLLGQQDVEENNRIKSLVKIYEGMKPKDAATIFNQMNMTVLLKVVSKMNERRVAPILAAMETKKANELTLQLTEMQKLPEQQMGIVQDAVGGPVPTPAPLGSAELPGLDALGQ